MKNRIILVVITVLFFSLQSCEDFLTKEPLGLETDQNFYNDETNAILAVNSIYDVASWDEGPGINGGYVSHNYEFMFGDVLSDDSDKGADPSGFLALKELEEFRADAGNEVTNGLWHNMYIGIFRANTVIKNLPDAEGIDADLKARLLAEATFLRGYFYFYLARIYGGVPLFSEPVVPSELETTQRASIEEVYAFVEADFRNAAIDLPLKSRYPVADMGRATQGAAQAYLARNLMYQVGFGMNGHTWQEVYDAADAVVASAEYSLLDNYAAIHEIEGENSVESIFEIQLSETSIEWGAQKVGSTNNVFQNNRETWGWGFNNPVQSFVDVFENNDPRLPCTVYADGDIVLGVLQAINYPTGNSTGYLSRKAATIQPVASKSGGQNIRKFRYADILLIKAEAAYHTGKTDEARDIVNQIRARALNSTKPKGSAAEGDLSYPEYGAGELDGALPDVTASGTDLLEAIYHERRVELGMEALRYWDLTRTGRLNLLGADIEAAALSHSVMDLAHPYPTCPIPISEVNDWGLSQNPGY